MQMSAQQQPHGSSQQQRRTKIVDLRPTTKPVLTVQFVVLEKGVVLDRGDGPALVYQILTLAYPESVPLACLCKLVGNLLLVFQRLRACALRARPASLGLPQAKGLNHLLVPTTGPVQMVFTQDESQNKVEMPMCTALVADESASCHLQARRPAGFSVYELLKGLHATLKPTVRPQYSYTELPRLIMSMFETSFG